MYSKMNLAREIKYDRVATAGRVKALIKSSDVTQGDVGSVLGIAQSNVSNKLRRESNDWFTIEQIIKLAVLFGVSTDYLLGRESNDDGQLMSERDVLKALFVLERSVKLDLVEEGEAEGVVFKDEKLVGIMRAWRKQRAASQGDEDMKRILEEWKRVTADRASTMTTFNGRQL